MDTAFQQAIELYGLEQQAWRLVKSQSNHIFESKTRILQLTPSTYKSVTDLLIEVQWIEDLRRRGFEVVTIVKSNRNQLLESVDECTIICYEKIVGTKASKTHWNESYFKRLGAFTGKLHRLGKSFEREGQYPLKNWDEIPKGTFVDALPKDHRDLPNLYARLISAFKTYPISEDTYGLVHYDIHHENYFLENGSGNIILFDFEMACTSWYINDISIILYYILNSVPHKDRAAVSKVFVSSFFEGYRQERGIEEAEKKKIPFFLLYRDLLVYAYIVRIWKEKDSMTENESRFLQRLSDSIEIRRQELGL